jgi:glutamyl-tRNA synthetase
VADGAPRVRFAPSPTGFFHVGSARTALYNWLFARHTGGTYILRIEDTDVERNREEWVDGINSALEWLGMTPDEGPYRQSERSARYGEAIDALWESGALYACDCTRADIEARTRTNQTPGYDGYCRERGLERGGRALRMRVPDDGATVVEDMIRGVVTFPNEAIEDFVVVKSSGAPLFVLANVVDDIDMGITHVIRGEDLLPSTPKGLLIWDRLERQGFSLRSDGNESNGSTRNGRLPLFAHLPMLVNEHGKKMSKRRDPVAIEAYRDEGYLASAMRNYLGLLGWSHPSGREIMTVDEMVEAFSLEAVNHAPAFFDVDKLKWMNGEYIRSMDVDDFVEACRDWLAPPHASWPAERFDEQVFRRMAPLVQERVKLLGEVPGMVDFFFLEEPEVDERSWNSVRDDPSSKALLDNASATYADCRWDAETLHAVTGEFAESLGLKLSKAQAPIRVAVTGRRVGPPLFESMAVLGRDAVLSRISGARGRLE